MNPSPYQPHGAAPPPPMHPGYGPPAWAQPPRRRMPIWGWILILLAGVVVVSCAGLLGVLAYVGSVSPDTKVYTSNEIPKRFVDIANELKLLDAGESMKFFYSDAITDVREGMYFVTDKKVVVYISTSSTPKTIVKFDEIGSADLTTSDSFFVDGSIVLTLLDGSIVSFPVSSEAGRDELMFDWIRSSIPPAKPEVSPSEQEMGDPEPDDAEVDTN